MTNNREKVTLPAPYPALTEGELLSLETEQASLTEAAKEIIAAELRKRGPGETDIAAFQRDAESAQSRCARWRRKQWMQVRELLSALLVWPGTLFIPLVAAGALVIALGRLRQGGLRLA